MNPPIDYDAQMVLYTQQVFRSLLDSTARPGQINLITPFPVHSADTENSFAPFILGIASTLLDVEVSFSVVNPSLTKLVSDIEFHTNSAPVSIDQADYIFMTADAEPQVLLVAKRGNLDYPDCAATVIIAVDYLAENQGRETGSTIALDLKGPGILGQRNLVVGGLSENFFNILREINSEFPLGLDLILVAAERIASLPRSITINVKRDE